MFAGTVKVRSYEKAFRFRNKEFKNIIGAGRYWIIDPMGYTKVDVLSMRNPWVEHEFLDLVIDSGALDGIAQVIELSDHKRALVWVENRFAKVLGPGQYALWNGPKETKVEIVDGTGVRFEHKGMNAILESELIDQELMVFQVDEGNKGVYFLDGVLKEILPAGRHVFWRRMGHVKVLHVDARESVLDVSGQEIMTKDKVSLRLNGVVTFKVIDPVTAVSSVDSYEQSLYREIQLALRAAVGTSELDVLLADKAALADQVRDVVSTRAKEYGVKVVGFGIRDIILPGEMKELLNKVVESKKVSEANLITRREETAAMRSQANTARLLSDNPTLMRLRELEVLEKVVTSSNLSVVCGEGGIADKVMKLI